MKNQGTIESYIQEENKKLAKLEGKKADIDRKIKQVKANIERYTLMKDSKQMNALSNALDGKGISIEDIMAAVANGDMLSLQEKMEADSGKEEAGTADGKENM